MTKPIDINEPKPGFYRRRLVRGGPWVPALIFWEYGDVDDESGHKLSDDVLHCYVNGQKRNPYTEWVFLGGQPITEAEYRFMVDDAAHARAHRQSDPKATPDQPIDLGKMDPIF